MARILFAWELGDNLGHLTRDLPLVRACVQAGHIVLMAVANLRIASNLLAREEGITLLQAPLLKSAARLHKPPINYADMLLHEGYADFDALDGAVRGWLSLIDLARPDLLVYNHAPTALLAARLVDLPVMLVGTGFEIPPQTASLPVFRPWLNIPEAAAKEAEQFLLARINPYLIRHRRAPLNRSIDLFSGQRAQLATFAELDPFGPRNDADYIGPIFALSKSITVNWASTKGRHVFAYLRPGIPSVEHLLNALNKTDAEVLCVAPGLPVDWPTRYPGVRFLDHPVDLGPLLPDADLVVTYGASTIATALLAGVPVLLIPQVIEQYLAGVALQKTGAGLMLGEDRSEARCASMLEEILFKPNIREAAERLSQRYADFDSQQVVERLYERMTALLRKS
ncbi:MAG: nucleotide disphospho-sugar-binding domain-containing protein [Pseudomonadota bacterium]